MTEDDRKGVYVALLRGLANDCQDQLCAADEQHAWSPWHRTALRHDVLLPPFAVPETFDAMNEIIAIKAERHCLNCGKQEVRRDS